MKKILLLLLVISALSTTVNAQRRMEKGMTYVTNPMPNMIIYHDSIYQGAREYRALFLRQGDPELTRLYKKHQSNKLFGQVFGAIGVGLMAVGFSTLSSANDKTGSWVCVGSGFISSIFGGYLTYQGRQNLQMAVQLINGRGHGASLGVGTGNRQMGMVYQF